MRVPDRDAKRGNRFWTSVKRVGKITGEKAIEVLIDKATEAIGKGIW